MIQWNDSLATGHPLIDQDHSRLINSLNELEEALQKGAGKDKIGPILGFLNSYTREHFKREEEYMEKVGCPAFAINKQAHTTLIAKLDGWLVRLEKGSSTVLLLEIYRELADWIRNHIIKVDCQLRGCKGADARA